MKRRDFIKNTGLGITVLSVNPFIVKLDNFEGANFITEKPASARLLSELINNKYDSYERVGLLWRFSLGSAYASKNPSATENDILVNVDKTWEKMSSNPNLKKQIEKAGNSVDKILSILVKALPGGEIAYEGVKILIEYFFKDKVTDYADALDRISDLKYKSDIVDSTNAFFGLGALVSFIEKGQKVDNYGKFINLLLKPKLGLGIEATSKEIFDSYPQIANFQKVKEILNLVGKIDNATGEIQIDIQRLETYLKGEISNAQELIKQSNEGVKQLLDNYKKEQARKEAAVAAERRSAQLDIIANGIDVASRLLGFVGDKKTIKAYATIAKGIVTMAKAINSFSKVAAAAGKGFATGNLIIAAVSVGIEIISLFMEPGPTIEEQILEEISKLREQINQLGEHIDKRFDRIEKLQVEIFKELTSQLNAIKLEVSEIKTDYLKPIQYEIYGIRNQLYRSESNILNAIKEGGERNIKEAMNKILAIKNNIPFYEILDNNTFFEYENKMYSWLTSFAEDNSSIAPTDRSTLLEDVEIELAKYSIWSDLNYIKRFFSNWQSLPRYPNLDIWVFIALGYSSYLRDRRNLSNNKFYIDKLKTIIVKGETILESLKLHGGQTDILFKPCYDIMSNSKKLSEDLFNDREILKNELDSNFNKKYNDVQNIVKDITVPLCAVYRAQELFPNDMKKNNKFIELTQKIDPIFIIGGYVGIGIIDLIEIDSKGLETECTYTLENGKKVTKIVRDRYKTFVLRYKDNLDNSNNEPKSLLREVTVIYGCNIEDQLPPTTTISIENDSFKLKVAKQIVEKRKEFFAKIAERLQEPGSNIYNNLERIRGSLSLFETGVRIFLSNEYIEESNLSIGIDNIRYILSQTNTRSNRISELFEYASKGEFEKIDETVMQRDLTVTKLEDKLLPFALKYLEPFNSNIINDPRVFLTYISNQQAYLISVLDNNYKRIQEGKIIDNTPIFISNALSHLKLTESIFNINI